MADEPGIGRRDTILVHLLSLCLTAIPAGAVASPGRLDHIAQSGSPPACDAAAVDGLIERWRAPHWPAGAALRACGESAVLPLVDVMHDETVRLSVRRWTARLLAQIGTETATQALLDASLEENELQAAVFQAFDAIRPGPAALAVLTDGLRSAEPAVRLAAIYGLAQLGPDAAPAIPDLVESLRLRVDAADNLQGSELEEERGMAAYALGEINPLDPGALQALGLTTSLRSPENVRGEVHLPENSKEVRVVASEALAKIENVTALLEQAQDSTWAYIALFHQHPTTLLAAFRSFAADETIDQALQLDAIKLIPYYFELRRPALEGEEISSLLDNLLNIVENKENAVRNRYYGIFSTASVFRATDNSLSSDTVRRLATIARDTEADAAVRRGAVYAIWQAHQSRSTAEELETALVDIFKSSQTHRLWHQAYETDQAEQLLASQDIGLTAFEALLQISRWRDCLNSPQAAACTNKVSMSGHFLTQLEISNSARFQELMQQTILPDDPYMSTGVLQVRGRLLSASVERHQAYSRPAVCRYGIFQRVVPRCR